jgi:hypothetical protein
MDAKGWQKCNVPRKLLNEAKNRVSDRQLRLFACALARLRWHKMEPVAREAVLAAERYLDNPEGEKKPAGRKPRGGAPEQLARACGFRDAWEAASTALSSLRVKKEVTLGLMRCLFENPYQPVIISEPWLVANDRAVLNLARSIGETGDFARMPILADALEDAGCAEPAILEHLRGGHRHTRNCWVLERLLILADPPELPRLLVWPEGPRGHADWPRAEVRREQTCPRCRRGPVRTAHLLPKGRTPHEHVFIRCVLCEHIEWVTTDGLGDPDVATLAALELVAGTCPECGGRRRAFRTRTTGENFGRAFLKCTDRACNSFEWADAGTRDMPKVTMAYWQD